MAAATPTPFANATTLAPQPQSRLADVMTPRGQHIPTWYDARTHADPANPGHINTQLFVKSRGIPLQAIDGEPFTIAEVPIERRWEVGADGEIIDQHVFQDQYVARIIEFYELAKRDNPKVSYTDDPRREPIPNVVHYVSEQVDPDDERRVMPMHYRNATAGAKPETLMGRDDQGETAAPHGADRGLHGPFDSRRDAPGRDPGGGGRDSAHGPAGHRGGRGSRGQQAKASGCPWAHDCTLRREGPEPSGPSAPGELPPVPGPRVSNGIHLP